MVADPDQEVPNGQDRARPGQRQWADAGGRARRHIVGVPACLRLKGLGFAFLAIARPATRREATRVSRAGPGVNHNLGRWRPAERRDWNVAEAVASPARSLRARSSQAPPRCAGYSDAPGCDSEGPRRKR
jgi:hypothetical protein